MLAARMALIGVCLLGSGLGAQPLPQDTARRAWEALNAGRAREAKEAFADALRTRAQDAGLLFGAGVAAHQLGEADTARRFLLDALKYDPALAPASLLLGEVLYAGGDLTGAIGIYQQALGQRPQAAAARAYETVYTTIAEKLERWQKEQALHDGFRNTLGDHFTVLFEGPAEENLARKAVEILEGAYWRVGSSLFTYPDDVITVVLYTREQFRDITQSPAWAGGAYDGRIRVPVQGALDDPDEFARVLVHEFVHAVVRRLAPRGVPQWLNEGIAMNFDGTDLDVLAKRLADAERVPSLRQLERPFAGLASSQAALAYARSAVAVRQLLAEAGAPAVVALLNDLGRGAPLGEAFEHHVLISYREFDER